jgi:hypothetical protein
LAKEEGLESAAQAGRLMQAAQDCARRFEAAAAERGVPDDTTGGAVGDLGAGVTAAQTRIVFELSQAAQLFQTGNTAAAERAFRLLMPTLAQAGLHVGHSAMRAAHSNFGQVMRDLAQRQPFGQEPLKRRQLSEARGLLETSVAMCHGALGPRHVETGPVKPGAVKRP